MATVDPKKIAVIGAGPAGLAAGLRLAQGGCRVDIYESQAQVGGLCRTIELWDQKVDLGPHRFFSQSDKVNKLWFEMVGREFSWVTRQTRIFYKQRYFEYPLQLWNTFINLGVIESFLCLCSYLAQKLLFFKKSQDHHFEGWIVARFGYRLYNIFFKTYSEKLWGLPCTKIDSDFAVRKIRRLSVYGVLKKFFSYRKTHVEYFAYPHHGTGSVYDKMAEKFLQAGGQLYLNSKVENISQQDGQVNVSCRLRQQNYDHIISTMPLPSLVRTLNPPAPVAAAARALKFRNTILVYLLVEGNNHFKDNWIYVHTPGVDFGRVTNFHNWSPELNGGNTNTVLCLEYWCNENEALWGSQDAALIENASAGLLDSGIIAQVKILAGAVYRVPKSYPIFELDYKINLAVLTRYLGQFNNICSIGRNGSFSYNNQDHSILMGLEAAENILSGLRHESVQLPATYEEDGDLPRFAVVEEI